MFGDAATNGWDNDQTTSFIKEYFVKHQMKGVKYNKDLFEKPYDKNFDYVEEITNLVKDETPVHSFWIDNYDSTLPKNKIERSKKIHAKKMF